MQEEPCETAYQTCQPIYEPVEPCQKVSSNNYPVQRAAYDESNPIIMPTIYKPLRRGHIEENLNNYQSVLKPYYGNTSNIRNPRQEYDEISRDMWADYFEDLKIQTLRENQFDYGVVDDPINYMPGAKNAGRHIISKNRKCLEVPGVEYINNQNADYNIDNNDTNNRKQNKVRIESKNNVVIEDSKSSNRVSYQQSDTQNWPIDSFKLLNKQKFQN
jgi:hypothetical protein